jgi:DNA polymerase I
VKNLLIIDGNSILNRAYYAIRPLTTRDGLFTHAVYGFINILLKHIEAINPDYGAVAFDLPAPTFRHKEYTEYKATRKGMPEELAMQLPYAKQCAELLGFKVLTKEGYEADDILGTIAHYTDNTDEEVKAYVLTGDRDSLQLINANINILLALNSDTVVFDSDKFKTDYGIDSSDFVDVKALMGDSSDNIPGVAGIGEKTAFKLISSFGNLEALYDALDKGDVNKDITKSIYQKLINGKENAFMSQYLARINTEVPLDISLDDLVYTGYHRPELMEVFTKLEFTALIKRLNLTAEIEVVQYEKISPDKLTVNNTIVTIELKNNILYIVSDTENYACVYEDIKELKPFFENPENKFCVYDSKYMYKFLRENDINIDNFEFDIILAAYVLNSSDNSYDITKLAAAYLNIAYDDTESDSAHTTHQLYKILKDKLIEENQYNLYLDVELPLAKVLADMEIYGFKVDRLGLVNFANKLQANIDEYAQAIYALAGEEFNINSPKQLGEILFDKMKLPVTKKKKTGYSTDAEVLEKLSPYTPIVDYILEYRQVAKLKSTYADGLLKVADTNGRVHTTFNQTVTATGRLSSTEPNLQNIPIRQALGREMRKYFLPESRDYVLIDADYSQIELRLLADISNDETMKYAFIHGHDIHTITASQVFNVDPEDVTPELRKRAKAVNFGIVYGMSDFSLAADIGVSKYHAGEYIKGYFETYVGVDQYMKDIVNEARNNGYVTTKFGRRRYIPELKSSKATLRGFGERVAMNSPIQGTAADIMKIAMINTSRALKEAGIDARLILQVHDELIVESHKLCKNQAAVILKKCMEDIAGFSVPLTVDITMGDTWYH